MRYSRVPFLMIAALMGTTLATAAPAAVGPQRGTGSWLNPADAADLDLDGFIGDSDFLVFSLQYDVMECSSPAMPEDCCADLNHDGLVDDADFVIFVREYNRAFAIVS